MVRFGIVLLLVSAGCLGPISHPSSTRSGTSGDTIIRIAGEPERTGELIIERTIGLVDGSPEYTFAGIADVAVGEDSAIYVLVGRTVEVREYDARGTFVRRIGRRGRERGEFEDPTAIASMPDGRLLVADAGLARIQVYSRTGQPLEEWPGDRRMERPLVVGSDGTIYLRLGGFGPWALSDAGEMSLRETEGSPIATLYPTHGSLLPIRPSVVVRLRSDGTPRDTVPAPPLVDLASYFEPPAIRPQSVPDRIYVGLLYSPVSWWTVTPNGSFVSGRTDRYAIDVQDFPSVSGGRARGESVIRIQRNVRMIPLLDGERRTIQQTIDGMIGRGVREFHGVSGAPTHKPAYRTVFPSHDGRLWVALHVPSTESRIGTRGDSLRWREEAAVYDIFEAGGRYVGQVSGPAGTRIRAINGDRVIAIAKGSMNADVVTISRVRWK